MSGLQVPPTMAALSEWRNLSKERKDAVINAICQAVDNDMHLAELECLGLEEKVINLLERHGISYVFELVSKSTEELLRVGYIGPVNLQRIVAAICALPDLEIRRKEYYMKICPNIKDREYLRFYGMESIQPVSV